MTLRRVGRVRLAEGRRAHSRKERSATFLGPLDPSVVNSNALLAGDTVSGNVGHEIFAAVPLTSCPREETSLWRSPARTYPVLVITRHVKSPVNGVGYFLLVAGVVLVIGAAVAALLARRISAPLVDAVSTTGQDRAAVICLRGCR